MDASKVPLLEHVLSKCLAFRRLVVDKAIGRFRLGGRFDASSGLDVRKSEHAHEASAMRSNERRVRYSLRTPGRRRGRQWWNGELTSPDDVRREDGLGLQIQAPRLDPSSNGHEGCCSQLGTPPRRVFAVRAGNNLSYAVHSGDIPAISAALLKHLLLLSETTYSPKWITSSCHQLASAPDVAIQNTSDGRAVWCSTGRLELAAPQIAPFRWLLESKPERAYGPARDWNQTPVMKAQRGERARVKRFEIKSDTRETVRIASYEI
nr:hypothetical protein Iba_chr12dCG19790 [Ipomoea batatas]